MVYVRVFGRVLKSTGEPWAKGRVLFELDNGSWTSQNNYPQNPEKAIANQYGDFSINLWANAEGLERSQYRCILPDGDQFLFELPPNFTEINITVLREGNAIPLPGGSNGTNIPAPIPLTVTALNTLSDLPIAPSEANRLMLTVNGKFEFSTGSNPAFSHDGAVLTWNAANAGYDLRTSYQVYAMVWNGIGGSTPIPAPISLTVTALNTLSDLPIAPSGVNRIFLYVNGKLESPAGSNPAFSHNGTALTWNAANTGYNLQTSYKVYALVW